MGDWWWGEGPIIGREMRPSRGVAARKGESMVIEVVPPVQDGVFLGTQEHPAAVAFRGSGVWVAGVHELFFDRGIVEEGVANGYDLAE